MNSTGHCRAAVLEMVAVMVRAYRVTAAYDYARVALLVII